MMKILLSNDDGVLAPGLLVLRERLSQIGHVTVIAPESDSSGSSSALTLSQPIRIKELEKDYFSLKGTPADCVHAALTGLLNFIPDIVISGINNRSNLGSDIIYSGTFAAAYEGRTLNYPAISLSMVSHSKTPKYDTAAQVCIDIINTFNANTFFTSGVLNVNVPDVDYTALKGTKITNFGNRPLSQPIIHGTDPRGSSYFWLGSRKTPEDTADTRTDFYAVKHGYVSMSPFNLNMTCVDMFSQLIKLF